MRIIGFLWIVLILTACVKDSTDPVSISQYDQRRPGINEYMQMPSVLVFSGTKAYRHDQGIAGANLFFVELARDKGYGIFTTETGAVFNAEDLARFDIVVFNNMTGDMLSAAQESAFEDWLEAGGGWIGLHGSGDDSHQDWPWYAEGLIGPRFLNHPADPQFQEARVVNLRAAHPALRGLPKDWVMYDEWYTFDGTPQDHGLLPLIGLDEASYRPVNTVYGEVSDLRMGPTPMEHPIVWAGCPGDGRALYSAIGHSDLTYKDANHRKLLSNAFDWVGGHRGADADDCPS